MEQPIQPSYNKMISILNKKERAMVTKEGLIKMEHEILTIFGFDFNFNCHNIFIERYLRILGYHNEEVVEMMSFELCKFSLNENKFLKYKPSVMAACSVLLSINIFRKEECSTTSTDKQFLDISNENPEKFDLNTKIWNNAKVSGCTGYTIEMLK